MDANDKPSRMTTNIDPDCETIQVGDAVIRIIRRKGKGTRFLRCEITAPRNVPIKKLEVVAKSATTP